MQFVKFYPADPATGELLPGASVAVQIAGETTLAPLFDVNGAAISNPLAAGNSGLVAFAAADGDYDVVVTSTAGAVSPAQRIYLFDPATLASTIAQSPAASASAVGDVTEAEIVAALADIATLETLVSNAVSSAEAAQASAEATASDQEDAADAALANALQAFDQLLASQAPNFTTAGLPVGPFVDEQQTVLSTAVSTLNVLGTVTANGAGFVLNLSGVYYANGVLLSEQVTELSSATAGVLATLTTSYLTATQTDSAIAGAQTTLQASINGVSATLTTNYLTSAQTNAAISAAQTTLQASINGVSANLTTNYLTSAETNSAISAAQTTLQASINGVSANLTTNYYTAVQVNGAISTAVSTAQTTLQANINGVTSNLATNYSTTAQVNGLISTAVSTAQTTLQSNINGVTSNLSTNYLTSSQVNGAISTAVAAAETTLNSSINGVSATLTNNYYTTVQVNGAIATAVSAAQTTLQANINGVSANLSTNYLTAAQTNSAISSAKTTLNASINGVSATVTQQAAAIATLNGYTEAYLSFTAAAGGEAASVTIESQSGASVIQLVADILALANPNADGAAVSVLQVVNGNVSVLNELFVGSGVTIDPTIPGIAINNGTNQVVLGENFGASGNLILWCGPSSVAISAMSDTNCYLCIDISGLHLPVISGNGAVLKSTSGSVNSSGTTYEDGLILTFTTIPAGGYWTSLAAQVEYAGTGDAGRGTGDIQIVERQSGKPDVVIATGLTWTGTYITSSPPEGSVQTSGAATPSVIATNYNCSGGVPVELVMQVNKASGLNDLTGCPASFSASWLNGVG